MSDRLRRGRAKAAGNDPQYGACCASRISRRRLLWQTEQRPVNVSRGRCDNGKPAEPRRWRSRTARADWIEVSVPALVSEEMFALAQEQLEQNKRHSPRRTVEPTCCKACWMRTVRVRVVPRSTRTSKQKLNTRARRRIRRERAVAPRHRQDGTSCGTRSRRWKTGLTRPNRPPPRGRSEADPLRKREEELRREQARVEKSGERLVTAYQEGLVTLAQLRQRMPACRKRWAHPAAGAAAHAGAVVCRTLAGRRWCRCHPADRRPARDSRWSGKKPGFWRR